jgi:alkanesulfonate monooxygenase SsuD/methylene tetrahydromethanopterin reductase-like flavin-dependent oxidoreductase (luciferase family)
MAQARKAEIGAQAVEQRERTRLVVGDPEAIGDLVADVRELGRGDVARLRAWPGSIT